MAVGNKQVTYYWQLAPDGKKLVINTTDGRYVSTLHVPEFNAAVIQGEEVIVSLKNGRTAVYTVRGQYKGTFI
jgi:hypothetical protein